MLILLDVLPSRPDSSSAGGRRMELSCARSRAYNWEESKGRERNVPEAAEGDPVGLVPETEPGAGDAAQCAVSEL